MVPNCVFLSTIRHHRNGLYGAQQCLFNLHWAPQKWFIWCPMVFIQISLGTIEMVNMVPNVVSLNGIGHHRNGFYSHWAPQKQFIQCPMVFVHSSLSTIVNMVPNGVSLNIIGHHRNGFYGAQWCFFKFHWAPQKWLIWCLIVFL